MSGSALFIGACRVGALRNAGRFMLGLVPVLLLVACAGNKGVPLVPVAATHPRSVAIIPVLRSEDLTLVRRSPVGFLGLIPLGIERIDRVSKQRAFEKQYDDDRSAVARTLTAALLDAARQRGFDAVVLDDVKRNVDDPDDFDYRRIETNADIVVHVRIADIGVFNPMTSTAYEPYVDAKVRVVARETGYEVMDETFYYGANGSKNDPFSVPSDGADRWPDFDSLLASRDRVSGGWSKGASALGTLIISKLPPPR